jgi:hypothetical protein
MAGQHQHEWNIEAFRSMAETGKAAQTALLTVAGGSSAAVLSFVGVLIGKQDAIVANLMISLRWFAGSLVATVLMSGLAYLAQAYYKRAAFSWSDARDERGVVVDKSADDKGDVHNSRGDIASAFVTGLFILALLLLIVGCVIALSTGPAVATKC